MTRDSFYTPADLAAELVGLLPASTEGTVVDPSMGEGALLRAAKSRFGASVSLGGIDVNPRVVRAAGRTEVVASRADFLSERARLGTTVWRHARKEVGAIVLNPPFSSRGMAGESISYGGKKFKVGPALHFLLVCLRETRPVYGIAAILPAGAVEADRYSELWQTIREQNTVRLTKVQGADRFSGARVATYLVYLFADATARDHPPVDTGRAPALYPAPTQCVEAIRGRYPVYRQRSYEDKQGVRFLHSTDLNGTDSSELSDFRIAPAHLAIEGPFLALRRVGGWREPVTLATGRYVLSDCVIALRPNDKKLFSQLRNDLENNGGQLEAAYGGTGAQYITMRRLSSALAELGWRMHLRTAGSGAGSGDCELCRLPAVRPSGI